MVITELMSDAELKNQLANFISQATENAAELGLDAGQLTELASLINEFNAAMVAVSAKKAELRSSVTRKNDATSSVRKKIASYAQTWRANEEISDATLAKLAVPLHRSPGTHVPASPPSQLTYTLPTETTIRLKWNRNGNRKGTVYNLQTSPTGTGDWTIVKTTTATKATVPGTPGTPTYFRVIALRAQSVSTPSNTAAVWLLGSELEMDLAA